MPNCLCHALPFRCGSLASWQVLLTSLFESSSNVCGAKTRNKHETKKEDGAEKTGHLEHWFCCKVRESQAFTFDQNPIFNCHLVR